MTSHEARTGRTFRALRAMTRGLLRAFFREIEVVGAERVPVEGGGLFVSWHPNALVDPALILAWAPRTVVFGARDGLFRFPLLGAVLRGLGTVPIYRAGDDASLDPGRRRASNERSLAALAKRVADGSFSALFPEGVSHDQPHPVALKSGTARLYYQARAATPPDRRPPVIVPVGLHYDRKRVFRSGAVLWFHPPLDLPADLDVRPQEGEDAGTARERARRLTAEIERVLHDAVLATEDWRTHERLQRVRKLVRAERAARSGLDPGRPSTGERAAGFAAVRCEYLRVREADPARLRRLLVRVERYDRDLRALGLEDHELDRPPRSGTLRLGFWLLLQALFAYVLLPPLLLVGLLVNAPAALLVGWIARRGAALHKDVASLKLMAGTVLFPLLWIGVGYLGFRANVALREWFPRLPDHPVLAGISLAVLTALGAAASVRYLHLGARTARALTVRLTRVRRRKAVQRLLEERRSLFAEMVPDGGRSPEAHRASSPDDS